MSQILMITPYLPCRNQSGGQTRSFYLIKHLSRENTIDLICFSRDDTGLKELKGYCRQIIQVKRGKTWDIKKVIATAFSPYPFLVTNYLSSELQLNIRQQLAAQKYDLIHTECFYLMPNIPKTDIPIILVDQTIEFAVYKHYVESSHGLKKLLRPFLMADVLKIKYWESYFWKKTDYIAAVSTEDQAIMSRLTGRKDIKIVENGVDEQYFNAAKTTPKTTYPSILFGISNMKWMQNSEGAQLLLKDIWPQIKRQIPAAKLYIIGRFAPVTFAAIHDPDIIISEAEFDGQKNDPQSYYQRCWILLAPILSGGGSRTKFFEAMASALPIVTTQQGIEGISIKNGQHALVCSYAKLADTAVELLNDPALQQHIGRNGQQLVKKEYSWEKSAQSLNTIYETINSQK